MKTIQLTKGMSTVVDDDVFRWANTHLWCVSPRERTSYVVRDLGPRTCRRRIYLHREIMHARPGDHVDHIDGDGLNNFRSNLRLLTNGQNLRNRHAEIRGESRFIGVARARGGKKWRAYAIVENDRQIHLGVFETEEQAASARDYHEAERHPGVATLNFPDGPPVTRVEIERSNRAKRGASQYRGIRYRGARWIAEVRLGDRKIHVGSFLTEQDAAEARDAFVIEHRSAMPRANLNFLTR